MEGQHLARRTPGPQTEGLIGGPPLGAGSEPFPEMQITQFISLQVKHWVPNPGMFSQGPSVYRVGERGLKNGRTSAFCSARPQNQCF